MNNNIKTRFAPSPTGELHVGGARTALFNYLFARKNKGEFLLRIEDTDRTRYVDGSVERIQKDLAWLGLNWDSSPTLQSENLRMYKEKVQELIDKDKAYHCFCTQERLQKMREYQIANKQAPKYDRHCTHLPKSKIDELLRAKSDHTIRLLVPDNFTVRFHDLIFGDLEFKSEDIDDQVLMKSDGYPTYHLANVVDDHTSQISHVIRGDEWLPSTPKHILLYQAFGWAHPQFAHLPLLVDETKAKLSKRKHGEKVWVSTYHKDGYLPDALLNFLAFLGWHPGDGETREIYSLEDLIKHFELEKVHKSSAVFDTTKLDSLNFEYLKKYTDDEIVALLEDSGLRPELGDQDLIKVVRISRDRANKLSDFQEQSDQIFTALDYNSDMLIFKKSDRATTLVGLRATHTTLIKSTNEDWTLETLNEILSTIVSDNNLANGDVFWPVRVSLSGEEKSPSPAELLWVLGKKESLERLEKAIGYLTQ